MKLEFEKPTVPNFIHTKQGLFALENLNDIELDDYAKLWCSELSKKWKSRKLKVVKK